jgi:hypothetical protein
MTPIQRHWLNEKCGDLYGDLNPFLKGELDVQLLRMSYPKKPGPKAYLSTTHDNCLTIKWQVPKHTTIFVVSYRYTGIVLINREIHIVCLEEESAEDG